MVKIRFGTGTNVSKVTIRDGLIQAPSPALTAILDTLAATLQITALCRLNWTPTTTLPEA